MEIQTTPASPPTKIRRIGSVSSYEGIPVEQNEQSEKPGSDRNDGENRSGIEETLMQPAISTTERSADTQASTALNPPDGATYYFDSVCVCDARENMDSPKKSPEVVELEINDAKTNISEKTVMKKDKLNVDCPKDDLDQILKDLECGNIKETKSMYELAEEYLNNPSSRGYIERFFRTHVQSFLISSGEAFHNNTASTELMDALNKADSPFIINFLAGLPNRSHYPIIMQGDNDEQTQNDDGAKFGTIHDDLYEYHLKKVTGSLFTDMRAEMHDVNDKDNIAAIGKILLNVFFTDQEIRDGFLRKQTKKDGKETQAYDRKRVFLMSQVIYFMITEKDDITVKKFKETTNKNNGLQGELYKNFVQSVMVDYANYRQKNVKPAKNKHPQSEIV